MATTSLALYGGTPIRTQPWPLWPRVDENVEHALLDALHSGRWTFSGYYHGKRCYERLFAEAFATYCGVKCCTPVASGTAALITALQALDVGPGDEVLVPAITWVACASSVASVGAKPVFVDIEEDSLCMCPEDARSKITPRTAAIMLVHLYCTIADITSFVSLSKDTGIPILEDCSQSHGTIWNGKRVGSFGRIGTFSMQQSKVLTCGEGGAVVTDDADLHRICEQLRADGRMFAEVSPRPGRMELVEIGDVQGQNRCLSELHSAILVGRLPYLDSELRHKEHMADVLAEGLRQVDGVEPVRCRSGVTLRSIYQFCMRLNRNAFSGKKIEVICDAMSAELGVCAEPADTPLYRNRLYQPDRCRVYRALWGNNGELPELQRAERASAECFTLPHHTLLGDDRDMMDIVAALAKVQKASGILAG